MASPFSRTIRSLEQDSARYALIAWFVAAVCLAAWLAWFVRSGVTVYEVSRKARLEVMQAPHALAALMPGKLMSTNLAIGRQVKAGDVLVELDAEADVLRLKEEETRLQSLPPRIASLRSEIAALAQATTADRRAAQAASQTAQARVSEAGAAVAFARDNERRLTAESGTGSIAEVDALRALAETRKLASARDALSSDVRRLELDAQTRAHQNQAQIEGLKRAVLSLEGDMNTAQATVARLKLEIDRHKVRAPVDGVIGEVLAVRPGAYVTEGQKLATIVPGGDLIIVADFNPASALGRVHAGQTARLRLDGFPWTQYGSIEAKVVRVGGEIRDNVLRVELAPSGRAADSQLMQHGLTGTVEVSIEQAPPATLLLRALGYIMAAPQKPAGPEGTPGS